MKQRSRGHPLDGSPVTIIGWTINETLDGTRRSSDPRRTGNLVGKGLPLKMRLEFQCHPDSREIVPPPWRAMLNEDVLEGLFVTERILNTIDLWPAIAYRLMPLSETGDDDPGHCDQDWLGHAPALQADRLVELNCRIDQLQSKQSWVQT